MNAELAEVVAGRALLGDFQRAAHEFTTGTRTDVDWTVWALRLGQHMQHLLDAVSQSQPAAGLVAAPGPYVARDGSAWLTAGDIYTVRQALAEAGEFTDSAMRARYGMLARQLGDDR